MADMPQQQTTSKIRQRQIISAIAVEAERRPLLYSGLWFHDDVRNNFYYASYLFAAAVDDTLELPFGKEDAKRKAESVLLETVRLQNRMPGTPSMDIGRWGCIPLRERLHRMSCRLRLWAA